MSLGAYRLILMGCQAASILITLPLWQIRSAPPLLPAAAWLPQLDMTIPLLISLAAVAAAPRVGVATHSLVYIYAVLLDQTRLQPQFPSLILLLVGTLGTTSPLLVARVHLVAMWAWAGISKLIGPDFFITFARRFMSKSTVALPDVTSQIIALGVGIIELGLALLVLFPNTRKQAAFIALGLHAGIFSALRGAGYVGLDPNISVQPWNLALALAGFAFLLRWRTGVFERVGASRGSLATTILVLPFGYYLGIVHPYLSHVVYSSNIPHARVCIGQEDCRSPLAEVYAALLVPLPPDPAVNHAYFAVTCRAEETLTIIDPRPVAWWTDSQVSTHACKPTDTATQDGPISFLNASLSRSACGMG